MPDINVILPDGSEQKYSNVNSVSYDSANEEGVIETFISERLIQNQIQTDWNQTDNTQPDYIKNNPFSLLNADDEGKFLNIKNGSINWESINTSNDSISWDELTETISDEIDIFVKQEIHKFYPESSYGGLYCSECSFPESGYTYNLIDSFSLNIGETYIIEWDGIEYESTAFDASVVMSGCKALGNGNALFSGLPGNSEPFVLGLIEGQGVTFVSLTEQVESHNIRIYKYEEPRKVIKHELLPTQLQFGEKNGIITIIDGEYKCNYTESNGWMSETISCNPDISLKIGETYIVTWNGIDYECTCISFMGTQLPCLGNTLLMSGPDNGLPFGILEDRDGLVLLPGIIFIPIPDPDETITTEIYYNVKISYSGKSITKIDSKYLYQANWDETNTTNASYITNKPFGRMSAGTVIYNNDNVQCLLDMGNTYVMIIDSITLIPNASYTVIYDNIEYNIIAEEIGNDYSSVLLGIDGIGMIITNYENSGINVIAIQDTDIHSCVIKLAENAIKKIDKQFLPDNIGSGSSLPPVTVADANKVLTVINGEWQARTPASGLPEITSSDNGKTLIATNGVWSVQSVTHPTELPSVTSSDAGKFLRVSANGSWIVETIQNVSETGL